MSNRLTIMAAVLLGLFLGLPVPVSVGAQGGDAVYRSLRLQIPLAREYMEPSGLQDAATDLLTSDFSTMSSSYQTIMSGSVTVGESGDAVLVHVTGQIGRMGGALYVVDNASANELWLVDDPTASGGGGQLQGTVPIRPREPGPASLLTTERSTLWTTPRANELWLVDDPTAPGAAVNCKAPFPSGITRPGRHHFSRWGALRCGRHLGQMNYGG